MPIKMIKHENLYKRKFGLKEKKIIEDLICQLS